MPFGPFLQFPDVLSCELSWPHPVSLSGLGPLSWLGSSLSLGLHCFPTAPNMRIGGSGSQAVHFMLYQPVGGSRPARPVLALPFLRLRTENVLGEPCSCATARLSGVPKTCIGGSGTRTCSSLAYDVLSRIAGSHHDGLSLAPVLGFALALMPPCHLA